MSYTSPANVKHFAAINYDQLNFATNLLYGAFIEFTLIPKIEALIDSYVGHDFFDHNTVTLTLDGSGKEALHINRIGLVGADPPHLLPLPLISVTSVTIDGGANVSASCQVYDTYIRYWNNCFNFGRQNVVIEARYGYRSVPTDVQYVTDQTCANILRGMLKRWLAPDVITKAVMESGSLTAYYAEDVDLTPNLKARLDRYRYSDIGVG